MAQSSLARVVVVCLAVIGSQLHVARAGCPFMHARGGGGAPGSRESAYLAHTESSHARSAQAAAPAWEGEIPAATNTSDPLVVMNDLFHQYYTESGDEVRPNPVIVVEGDYLVLLNNSKRVSVNPFTPVIYHDLKMVCHMPLAVLLILEPVILPIRTSNTTVALPAQTQQRLSAMLADMRAAQAALTPQRYPASGQLARQQLIANATINFAARVLGAGVISYTEAEALTRSLAPHIWQNVQEAGAAQVAMLHKVMQQLEMSMSSAEWESMQVVVTTSHMARPQNLVSQYMSRAFDVDIFQSHKFVTLEEISSEAAALTLLDTHVTDYGAGAAFFGDAYRMHEDILCGAAKQALDKIFPATDDHIGCFNTTTPIQ